MEENVDGTTTNEENLAVPEAMEKPSEEIAQPNDECEETPAADTTAPMVNETECLPDDVKIPSLTNGDTSNILPEKREEKTTKSTTDFEWNFDSPTKTNNTKRKEEFDTLGVATARREARERSSHGESYSPPERRA